MCVYLSASLKSGSHSIPGLSAHFSRQPVIFRLFRSKTVKLPPILFYIHEVSSHRQPVPGIASANPRYIVLAISQVYIGCSLIIPGTLDLSVCTFMLLREKCIC